MAIVIGITGSLCSGKTTAASIFAKLGAVIIDADRIVHRLIQKDGTCFRDVVSAFGTDVVSKDGINRRKLADIVFKDKEKLRQLENIIHPAVVKEIKKQVEEFKKTNTDNAVLVLDVPLLFESGLSTVTDFNIVVNASYEERIKRAINKLKISRADAVRRISAQMPVREKIRMADFVLDNNKGKQHMRKQLKNICREILGERK